MSAMTGVKNSAHNAAFSPVMEVLTRLGYGVRGVIYIVMGILAVQVALGKGGALASPQGAIAAIGKQPAGMILLWVVLIGILAYSLWGLVRAIWDPLNKGSDTKGILTRIGYFASAVGYAFLAYTTYGFISGTSQSTNGSPAKILASVMAIPMGRWAIALIGLIVVAVGLYQIMLGIKAGFEKQFQTYDLTPKEAKLATDVGRFGTAARGVVFALVGILIFLAAYNSNPSQPVGMDAALATLLHQPYGIWLLGIVAVGLVAFGFYSLLGAIWFRFKR
jgi:uncharacterized membrane protein